MKTEQDKPKTRPRAPRGPKPGSDSAPDARFVMVEWDLHQRDAGAAGILLADLFPRGFELLDETTLAEAGPGRCVLRVYVPEADASASAGRITDLSNRLTSQGILGSPGRVRVAGPVDRNWADRWKTHFQVQRVGSFVIAPPWKEKELDLRTADTSAADASAAAPSLVLIIEPGQAFGTGQHPTTRMCLSAMQHLHRQGLRPASVLDFGCGSGILALAAALLWPDTNTIVAVDTDPLAIEAAHDNAERNGLAHRLAILPAVAPSLGSEIDLGRATFDLVLANIRLNVLRAETDRLLDLLRPNGTVVLSGLFDEDPEDPHQPDGPESVQSAQLLAVWRSRSPRLAVTYTLEEHGWVCLTVVPDPATPP